MKCRYIEELKNGPVTGPFGHGPVTGLVNFYLCNGYYLSQLFIYLFISIGKDFGSDIRKSYT